MSIPTIENKEHLILPAFIDRPDLQSRRQRGLFGLINFVGWVAWIYLFLPLLTLVAWWFGYYRFDQYILLDQKDSAIQQLQFLAVLIIFMNLTLLAWASYNYLRFRDNERRFKSDDVQNDQIAHFYELETVHVEHAQHYKICTFYYDDHGKILDIRDDSVPIPHHIPESQHL